MSATTPSPRAWTRSWCRCARKLASGQTRRDHHRAIGGAEAAVAGVRGHRQGAHGDPPLPQAPRARGRGRARPSHARSRAGGAGQLARPRCRRSSSSSYLAEHRYPRLEELLADIALGNRMPAQVAQVLLQRRRTECARRQPRAPHSGEQILITGTERGVLSFAQLLPSDSRRRDHGLPSAPARASWCIALRMPERGRIPQVARTLGADRPGIATCRAITACALRIEVENKPGRAGPGRRRRSPRPIPTSTRSSTASATCRSSVMRFAHRGARPQAPGRCHPPGAPPGRGARRASGSVAFIDCRKLARHNRIEASPCPVTPSTPTQRRPPSARIRRPCAAAIPCTCPGQIPLDPATGQLVEGDIAAQARRVFDNLQAVCEAAGGSLDDVVRVGIYLTDLGDFAAVNAVMAEYFSAPYPARSTIEVAGVAARRAGRSRRRSSCSTEPAAAARQRQRAPALALATTGDAPLSAACRASARRWRRSWPRAAC